MASSVAQPSTGVSAVAAMKPIERVAAAFAGKPTDKVPVHHIQFSSKMASLILGREAYVGGGIQQFREACALWQSPTAHAEFLARTQQDAVDISIATEQDMIRPYYWRMNVKPAQRIDDLTFLYGDPKGEWHINRYFPDSEMYQTIEQHPPKPQVTLEDLEKQVAAEEKKIAEYKATDAVFADPLKARELSQGQYAIRCGSVWMNIPYEPEIWLEATLVAPELVGRLLDTQLHWSLKNIPVAARLGVQYLFGGGDFATNTGPMFSPKVFHELMLPRLKRTSDECHKYGLKHLFGSDGNSWLVSEDLFGASGVDGYFEIDRLAGMDLRKLRQKFPNLTLIGNISSLTLHNGSKQEVIEQTLDVLETAKQYGRILVGCSNQVTPETPPENLFAMLETIKKHR